MSGPSESPWTSAASNVKLVTPGEGDWPTFLGPGVGTP